VGALRVRGGWHAPLGEWGGVVRADLGDRPRGGVWVGEWLSRQGSGWCWVLLLKTISAA
jgi:hypothetical protein